MKRTIPAILFVLFSLPVFAQKDLVDTLSVYFSEIKTATKKQVDLWEKDLYGAMLLVDRQTRQVFANEADPEGALKKLGNIYSGYLPQSMSIANTALEWNGKYWAMIILPLPGDKQARLNLLAHELFHRAQSALGFSLHHSTNNHLDQKDGRVYLRLELAALKKAIQASSNPEILQYLKHALTFRKYRHQLYPGSDTTENILELNEGLAEFTGVMMSGRNKQEHETHFLESINNFLTNPTFVRSFAYETTPVYGYLLYKRQREWLRDISQKTNLTGYFIAAFGISLPADLEKSVDHVMDQYNGQVIISEEEAREKRIKKLIAKYKQKFIEAPHFDILLEDMRFAFDPRTIIPLEDKGTVYPEIRVTDKWGILTVENGALITPSWKKITLSVPTRIGRDTVSGDSWVLELAEGYTITKDEKSGNYTLAKD